MQQQSVLLSTTKIKKIEKRDGSIVELNPEKIKNAIKKAFNAQGIYNESIFENLTNEVVNLIEEKYEDYEVPTVEEVQDLVETVLILNRYNKVAKAYILYRTQHTKIRKEKTFIIVQEKGVNVIDNNNQLLNFDVNKIKNTFDKSSSGLTRISIQELTEDVSDAVYNEMPLDELKTLIINVSKARIGDHYEYSALTSRLVINELYERILNTKLFAENLQQRYEEEFSNYLEKGIAYDLINPELRTFNLNKIAKALVAERDFDFYYLGIQTLYDRYLLRQRDHPKRVFELPQWMWMRVAMGLALKEANREDRAIEFYNMLSQFYVVSSTPTLFNSGTTRSQMSSCFLNSVEDSLEGIFKIYSDNAQLCKWAGAVGTDWTPVRSKGSKIIGTNGHSQGTIPFIKIFNDVALAVNQGGKRKGALAAYLEIWHADVEEFLELRKNTGDERRRAHDIHTAVFIPDLFMKRLKENGTWTLFSSDDVPGLHDSYGKDFERLYEKYEKMNIPNAKKISAQELWRKTLTMLYETGHPWITFKDPMNIRSPQNHVGIIHGSNLCTEITLNTSKDETAVCNLASINLAKLIKNNDLDEVLLEEVVTTVVRMLNNVIDVNFYTINETKNSNLKHRPIGLGIMAYQDALYELGIDFESANNLEFADKSMEMISYYALLASSKLAKEFGPYPSYKGSKWDLGFLPIDTIKLLEQERGLNIQVDRKSRMDWNKVREHIKQYGMRNSNVMAIAPTATIANIAGVIPCVEPIYKNLYMKENMSGSFVVINKYLVDTLERSGLWDKAMLTQIKIHNGSLQNIDDIPDYIKARFKEAFEIDQEYIIKAAALRSKWIDQSASTNLFVRTKSGKIISELYMQAWEYGLKTTYYLRTLAASQVTKTLDDSVTKIDDSVTKIEQPFKISPKVCSTNIEECESCQ